MMCRLLVAAMLAGLLLSCGVPPAQPGAMAPVVALDTRLMAGARSFEVRGVNYIHTFSSNIARCPALQFGADSNCPWDDTAIALDMERLRGLGVNAVRVFLNYYVFGGAQATNPGYSLEQPLAHLDSFIAEANRQGIYVLPVLLAKYPQDRFGPDSYATALDLHVLPVVRHLAGRPGLLGWDLFNEPDLGGPVDARCWDWDNADFGGCLPLAHERLRFIQAIHTAVKQHDPQRLTTVSLGFAKNYFEPAEAPLRLADLVDFYSFHYYDDDPYDSGRYGAHWYYGQGFPADLSQGIFELQALNADKPIVITELGFPTGSGAKRSAAELRPALLLALRTARAEGAPGVMLWPFQPRPEELVSDLFTRNPRYRLGPLELRSLGPVIFSLPGLFF